MFMAQIALPGFPEAVFAAGAPELLTAPAWALELIREAVIDTLPDFPPSLRWIEDLRAGCFDEQPLMQAAIAGWLARGGRK